MWACTTTSAKARDLRLHALTLLAVCCLVTIGVDVRAETPESQYVLPPAAESVLRIALFGSTGSGDSDIGLAQVTLDKDRVTLAVTMPRGGATVTLRHPSVTEGAVATVPAFSIHGQGLDASRLSTLTNRLSSVALAEVWREVTPEESPEAPAAGDRSPTPDPAGLVAALHAAREAIRLDQPGKVDALVGPFRTARDTLSAPARVDIAIVLWQSGDRAGAGRMVEGIGHDTAGTAIGWQAALLRGETPSLEGLRAALDEADTPCQGLAIAKMLEVTDQAVVAAGLVAHLAGRTPPCPRAQVERVRRLLNSGEVAQADTLSRDALAHHPDVKELVSVRGRVLIAAGKPQEAAALLEARAFRDPRSVSLSSLLGAYNRVESIAWKRAKMDEMAAMAKADPDNHLAAFIAGVLFHYDGRLAESNALLSPLLDTSLDDQARLYIYLGMNAFDLGDAKTGLAYVDQAARDKHPDPDVHYCRAEILRMTDPVAARDALQRYMAQTDQSATKNSAKQGRVATLLANLERCVADKTTTPCPGPWEHPRGEGISLFDYRTSQRTPGWAYPLGLLVLCVVGLGIWFRRRRAT